MKKTHPKNTMTKPYYEPILLDGKPVKKITAFLFHKGGNNDPHKLKANESKSFIGSYVLGMGFTFDDSNDKATPISEMHRLIAENPKNSEVIFPYIGGSEVNSSATHQHHRYVINFGEMSEDEARNNYPDLIQIVEEKVKPERLKQKREIRKRYWWRFGETTPALFRAIAPLNRVLVCSRVNPHCVFAFLPQNMVYAESMVVFSLTQYSVLALLQSRIHEIWARFFSSTAMDLLRYSSSDCFETFPFPLTINNSSLPLTSNTSLSSQTVDNLTSNKNSNNPSLPLTSDRSLSSQTVDNPTSNKNSNNSSLPLTSDTLTSDPSIDPSQLETIKQQQEMEQKLEDIGKQYYEYRANLMIENNQGLTETYNRFHDPEEQDPAIIKLRELHQEMDRVVLDAYGWTDINPTCEFLLDYEEENEDENDNLSDILGGMSNSKGSKKSSKRNKKKPWRYRWNEETHDEILARLLDLNEQRYEEEKLRGETAESQPKKSRKKTTRKKKSNNNTLKIPGFDN